MAVRVGTHYERVGFSGMSPAVVRMGDGGLLLARRFVADDSIEPGVEVRVGSSTAAWSEPVQLVDPYGTRLRRAASAAAPPLPKRPGNWLVFFCELASLTARAM